MILACISNVNCVKSALNFNHNLVRKKVFKLSSIFLLILISGCSLMGENQWSAYKVIVDVQNESGQAIANASLESSDIKSQTTNESGRAELQFRSAGLHVVTIVAENKTTKQIKIALPQDDNKIINVTLSTKP